jgi:hypothetical protein
MADTEQQMKLIALGDLEFASKPIVVGSLTGRHRDGPNTTRSPAHGDSRF